VVTCHRPDPAVVDPARVSRHTLYGARARGGGWVQASLDQRQRFQQLFFPEGISFNGSAFVGIAVTAPAFSYLQPTEGENEGLVDQNSASWNRVHEWLTQISNLLSPV
jgi:hypothetical protein